MHYHISHTKNKEKQLIINYSTLYGVALCLGVLVISFLLTYLVLAWAEPSTSPPDGNVSAPLNVGNTGQSKSGGLIVNTGGAAVGFVVDKGNVGIGTTTPSGKLEVSGTGNVILNTSGNVGIGTNSPAKKLEVKGDVLATDVCNTAGACLSMLNDFIGSQPLAGNLHTRVQCKNEGGEVVDIGLAYPICRFTAASCPIPPNSKYGTWYQFDNWSVTAARKCCGSYAWGQMCGECGPRYQPCGQGPCGWDQPGCTTGYHSIWSNVAQESCPYNTNQLPLGWVGPYYGGPVCRAVDPPCRAYVNNIGCK